MSPSQPVWEVVIGLEIHVQLSTTSKLFSGASTTFGAVANSQACAVDLGLPGVLPVVNGEAYRKAVRFGLAVGAEIGERSVFDRKNYFYPDLPKGYQITQLDEPIVKGGQLKIETDAGERVINITRAHLEEDAGKSLHEDYSGMSGIDLNRAGTPLIEIVSEPELRSSDEAVAYARAIHRLVTWLDVSDGEMAEGSFRCDANVSIRPVGTDEFGTRTETKNVNSFRFLQRAIEYEIVRQRKVLEEGGRIVQETRLYDPDKDETRPMRSKETATDYRYFPEPDLLPVQISREYIDEIRTSLPELPDARSRRFVAEYALSGDDAQVLTSSRALSDYFEQVASESGDPRAAGNWVRVELLGRLHREDANVSGSPISALQLAKLISRISDKTISGKAAKQVFDQMWESAGDIDDIIEAQGLKQVSDSAELEPLISTIIDANPKQADQFRAGKDKVLGFFVGRVMKETRGAANPQQVNQIVRKLLRP
jgi:aspartyl-tRNA(Asn)/glutamyl-tRNA(Gln) amidotransferase subunit B